MDEEDELYDPPVNIHIPEGSDPDSVCEINCDSAHLYLFHPQMEELYRQLHEHYGNQPDGKPEKLRIYINRKLSDIMTPNKRAAHAVHAALRAFDVHPGVKVIVLDKGPTEIEKMRTIIHDAGHTELEPGTLTAGTNWPEDSNAE